MTEPPPVKSVTELLTWMMASAFLVLLGVVSKKLMSLGDRDKAKPVEPSPERQTVEAGLGVSTAGVSDETVTLVARLYGDVSALRVELGLERTYAEDLDEHIDDMIAGHATGRYPPWPSKPTRSGSTRA